MSSIAFPIIIVISVHCCYTHETHHHKLLTFLWFRQTVYNILSTYLSIFTCTTVPHYGKFQVQPFLNVSDSAGRRRLHSLLIAKRVGGSNSALPWPLLLKYPVHIVDSIKYETVFETKDSTNKSVLSKHPAHSHQLLSLNSHYCSPKHQTSSTRYCNRDICTSAPCTKNLQFYTAHHHFLFGWVPTRAWSKPWSYPRYILV